MALTMALGILLLAPMPLFASSISYEYDSLGRLVRVSYTQGTVVQFRYDPAGNRIEKVVTNPPDADGDGIPDMLDNCPSDSNQNQANLDGDSLGDVCDPDIDNDGMPNDYESDHQLDPYDASDADLDADNDGYSNLQEYQQGTDPKDPGDKPGSASAIIPIIRMLLGD